MSAQILADAGPPRDFVEAFLACSAVGALLFVIAAVWLGLWLGKRRKRRER